MHPSLGKRSRHPRILLRRTCATKLEPREIILPLPWGNPEATACTGNLRSDMYFRMAGGCNENTLVGFAGMPWRIYFYGGIDLPGSRRSVEGIHRALRRPWNGDRGPEGRKFTTASSGPWTRSESQVRAKKKVCGFTKSPAIHSPLMPNFPAAQVEARASALRFDTIQQCLCHLLVRPTYC